MKLNTSVATFAGGCFWCMESAFESLDGILDVSSGYLGGKLENPTYEQVSLGTSGHYEAIQITFDNEIIKYKTLINFFWRQIDPTDGEGSFSDRGLQYRSAIFYHNLEQKHIAKEAITELISSHKFNKPIATKILAYKTFYTAKEYHQNYYLKNPIRYNLYRKASGRDEYIKQVWNSQEELYKTKYNKPSEIKLKNKLSHLQYMVTQHNQTEKPFQNEYWDNKKEGIYVDIVTGEPLFSSNDKFKSGTGWPSFTKPIKKSSVIEQDDNNLLIKRIELKSKIGNSHLGHVFNDGPAPNGIRYCINSASLKFIPKKDLIKMGYSNFEKLFSKNEKKP